MKKYILLAGFLLSGLFVTACGAKKEEEITWQGVAPGMEDLSVLTDRTEYYDLSVEREEIFQLGLWEKNPMDDYISTAVMRGGTAYIPITTQFLEGEPVQLWVEADMKGKKLYLYRKDGEKELLLEKVPQEYANANKVGSETGYQWYLDRDGDFYCYWWEFPYVDGEYRYVSYIVKILSSGDILYKTTLETGLQIMGVRQMGDGRIMALLREDREKKMQLAGLNPDTGELVPESVQEVSMEYMVSLGTAGEGPALIGYSGADLGRRVAKVNEEDGSLTPLLYFTGTSYGWHDDLELRDFQVLEDGAVELLWTKKMFFLSPKEIGTDGILERLRMEKVEKTPIVLRGVYVSDWLGERVSQFNMESKDYHVIMETCGWNNDREDFARLTSVQVATGKGPDILDGFLMKDYMAGMLEKGALEDLRPYMETTGIKEEDYFPLTFSAWRQEEPIYGVSPRMDVVDWVIKEEVLGSGQTPDVETLMDVLLSWEGGGIYYHGYDSVSLLELFLQASDSLYGMVDWEADVCDFDTPLFGKLLEAAKRYGDDGRHDSDFEIAGSRLFDSVVRFKGQIQLEDDGMTLCGYQFDDGCHALSSSSHTMGINANSPNKEGAWEFISYLIAEESQSANLDLYDPPVNRKSFAAWMEWVIDRQTKVRVQNGVRILPYYSESDATEEKQAEYIRAIEEARPMPMRIVPILAIIQEEAEDYFRGYKSASEVSQVINNRVQLYLDEGK